MKKLLVITALMVACTSCAHNPDVAKSKPVDMINADVNTVFDKTLEILNAEGMTIEKTNKNRYFVNATQYVPRSRGAIDWTQGPDISVRLTPAKKSEGNKTKIKIKGVFNYFERDSRTPIVLEDDESEAYIDELIERLTVRIKARSEGSGGE